MLEHTRPQDMRERTQAYTRTPFGPAPLEELRRICAVAARVGIHSVRKQVAFHDPEFSSLVLYIPGITRWMRYKVSENAS